MHDDHMFEINRTLGTVLEKLETIEKRWLETQRSEPNLPRVFPPWSFEPSFSKKT